MKFWNVRKKVKHKLSFGHKAVISFPLIKIKSFVKVAQFSMLFENVKVKV